MNQANPMLSSLCIFSAVNEDFSPLRNFLYSARCVDTHRPRAVFSLNLVGTWQLPSLAAYWMSSSCVQSYRKKVERYISHHQQVRIRFSRLSASTYIFLIPSNLPPALSPPESNALESFQPFSVRVDMFPSSRFLCSCVTRVLEEVKQGESDQTWQMRVMYKEVS